MKNKFSYQWLNDYRNNSYRIAFIVAGIMLTGLFIFRLLLIFSYNGEVGGIDNNFIYEVTGAMTGNGFYTNPAALPYSVTLYPPLYLQLCAAIGHIVSVNPDDPIQVYRLCRSVSLACDIGTCLLLCSIIKKRFVLAKELSWLMVAGFACLLCLLGYTFSRCDSLLLVFYAAMIYVLTGFSSSRNSSSLLVLAILSVGCIFSKQNGLLVPLLILSWLLIEKAKKAAALYFLFFAVLFTGLLLFYSNRYPFLFDNTVRGLANRIDFSWFYTEVFKRMINSLYIIPLFIATGLSLQQLIRPGTSKDKSLALIFIIQLVFSLGTTLKWGSTVGYFNECFFLSFIIIGKKITDYSTDHQPDYLKKALTWVLPLLLLFFAHVLLQGYLFYIQRQQQKKEVYLAQREVRDYLRPRLQGKYVLNLAEPNRDFFKTFFYKEIAVPNTDIVGCCTLPDHTFDYSSLQQDIATGKIAYIIYPGEPLQPALWGFSLHSFQKDSTINGYTIYQYRP